MSAGRVKAKNHLERDHLEEAQSILAAICLDLDEVTLRMSQAIRRTTLVSDVLFPAVERLEMVRGEVHQAQGDLRLAWEEGQRKKWGRR